MNHAVEQSRQALDLPRLRERLLAPTGPLQRLEWLAETGSTNTLLAEQAGSSAADWPDFSLLTAEQQSQGRGRLDRGWQVPTGGALTLSLLLRPDDVPVESLGWLSMLSALAVCQTLQEKADLQARIKWPNDVVVIEADGLVKKICGVLAQLVLAAGSVSGIVVGCGVNISQRIDELPTDTSTSVFAAGGKALDRNILIEEYLLNFSVLYRQFLAVKGDPQRPSDDGSSLVQQISALMITLDQQVRAELPGGKFLVGRAAGLDATGALLITDAQGASTVVSAADVVHLRKAQGSYA